MSSPQPPITPEQAIDEIKRISAEASERFLELRTEQKGIFEKYRERLTALRINRISNDLHAPTE